MEKENSIFFERFKCLFAGVKQRCVLFIALLAFVLFGFMAHPYYVSVTEIKQNSSGNLELSCRIFTDNIEKALKQRYGQSLDLIHPSDKKLCDSLLQNYMNNHIHVWINKLAVDLDYLGYEKDEDAVMIYLESKPAKKPGTLRVKNELLYESYPEQINMIHVSIGGARKSTKLSLPDKEANFHFPG